MADISNYTPSYIIEPHVQYEINFISALEKSLNYYAVFDFQL